MEENRKITNSVVLVTGGAGFIGSNLCEILLQQNNVVRCLDNFSTGYRHNLNDFIDHPDFTLIEGDICNIQDCKKAVKGVDFVLHQAALGSVPRSIKNPIKTTDVNIGGFVKMLFASVEAGVKRFVYAASSSTYGDRTDLPKIEHQIGKALSPYGITKYVDELFAANFSELYGIETIGLRYFNVFGRRQDPNGVYAAVIPKFIQSFIRHESPVINGDGSFSRDFTYIDNVLQVNQLAALTPVELIQKRIQEYYVDQDLLPEISPPHFLSQVFNVAHGEQTNLNELTEILRSSLSSYDSEIKNISVQYASERKGDIPHSKASVRKAQMILKYESEYSVREGLQEAMKWYWTNRKMNYKPMNQEQDFFAHETAVIDTACEIGEGTRIWHFSHIMSHCKIGKNCNIGQNVVVSPNVQLGQNVKIQNNVSVYTGVSCEDDVFLGPSMVFTNIINPRSAINRKNQYDRTIVRKGASIGANATIICGVEIGKYALIGAGAVVTKNIADYALVVGNPAQQIGWVSEYGHRLSFNEQGIATCEESGEMYRIIKNSVNKL